VERKFILLIENDNKKGRFCYRGLGTADQIRGDINKLTNKGVAPKDMSVVPVIGSRVSVKNILIAALGISLTCWIIYENLYKRTRKKRKHSST